jgi:hypothetical protein
MKKILFIMLFSFLFSTIFTLSFKAQVYSEAPITISDKKEILTDMLYIKFKHSDVIKFSTGESKADGESISDEYTGIKKLFRDYCREKNIELIELQLIKAIPEAREKDTLCVDKFSGEIKILPNLARIFIVEFPKPVDVENFMARLRTFSEIEYVHGPVQWVDCSETPNDPKYIDGSQWYLDSIQAPGAWSITKGNLEIKIALIEGGGVELTHTDLQSKIVGGDGNPGGIQTPHGTNVAGIAGANTDNGTGIASLGWNISLLTYKPYNDDEYRTKLAQKITQAVNDGAHVINCSFRTIKVGFEDCNLIGKQDGSTHYYYYNWDYDLVQDVIGYAIGNNIVVVASAGNAAQWIGDYEPCELVPYPCYPAQYSGVIAVSGSQQNNTFVEGWNFGSFVDINAPGRTNENTGLWSTDLNNSYTNDVDKTSGTSFSAPQVSALAALLKSLNPSYTPNQIEMIIEQSANKIGSYNYVNGWNSHFGYGRINAHQAVLLALAYDNKSTRYDATAHNNNHVIERGFFGKLHEVFHSGGEIFYRRSSNNGDSWEITERISTGNGSNNHPSIAAGNTGSTDVLCLVWQKRIDSRHYDIMYSISSNMGTSWSTPQIVPGCSNVWISLWQSGDYYGPGPTPVVASFVGNDIDPRTPAVAFLLVYATENGLHYRYSDAWYLGWLIPVTDIIPGSEGSNSKNWYPSLATYNSQDYYHGYYRVNLTYDTRFFNVYSQIFNYLSGSVSWTNRVQVNSSGDNNRFSSIAVDYAFNRLAVWSGWNGNQFAIRFRKGFANGTWSSWYKEWSVSGVNSLCPSVTYYNKGGTYPYGIDILWSTESTSPMILNKRYSGREDIWVPADPYIQEVSLNSNFSNLTHERQNSSLPIQIWTDQSAQPYSISYNTVFVPKGDLLTVSEIRRAAEIADTSDNSYLRIELSEPIVTLTNGEEFKIPFKGYNYLDTLELSTENIFDYLQTELVSIPNNAQSITFKVEINASQPDTLSDGTLNTNPQTPFRIINFRLLAKDDSSHILLNNIGNRLLNNLSGLHHYFREFTVNALVLRRKNVRVIPNINLSGTFNQSNLYFTLVNVSIEGDGVGKDLPQTDENITPTEFTLEQNFPNPFNPTTQIRYSIVEDGLVTLKVYDVLGREVAVLVDEEKPAGTYEAEFNASNLSSGIYFYSISAGSFHQTKKMILLR